MESVRIASLSYHFITIKVQALLMNQINVDNTYMDTGAGLHTENNWRMSICGQIYGNFLLMEKRLCQSLLDME